ncbi:hypothetical protein FRC01_003369 [Tulasnella sp. 417]|nr:hypothetical protein FRC01_003369 [Tulasnella sp. 417]
MNEPASRHKGSSTEHADLATLLNTVLTNAVFLQAREPTTTASTRPSKSLRSLLAENIPAESQMFSLFSVAPGGLFGNLDRVLLIWASLGDPSCQSLRADVSDKAKRAIFQTALKATFGHSVRGMRKAEQELAVQRLTTLVDTERAEMPPHKIITEVIQAVFGQPIGQMGAGATSPEAALEAQNTNQSAESNFGAEGEKSDDPELVYEEVRSKMETLHISARMKGHIPTVTLVSPPPGHPTTSILRPLTTSNSRPEQHDGAEHDGAKPFSPLDYRTNIGNASVVHRIYLEARTTGVPRTAEQELARRRRASEMVFKEMKEVGEAVIWHRNGRGYKEGPWPSVLRGIDDVPKEKKRKWLLERRAEMIKRRSECRLTIWDNNEAADHIFVVLNALYVCREAGAEGIIF